VCVEYHWTIKLTHFISFFKLLAGRGDNMNVSCSGFLSDPKYCSYCLLSGVLVCIEIDCIRLYLWKCIIHVLQQWHNIWCRTNGCSLKAA
jgi:hypothetical protein